MVVDFSFFINTSYAICGVSVGGLWLISILQQRKYAKLLKQAKEKIKQN